MKRILFTLIVLTLPMGVLSQVAVVPLGGHASANGGELTVSLGQCASKTVYDTAVTVNVRTASLTEGVLQPYLSFELTHIEDIEPLTCAVSLFPNPTTQSFTLETDETQANLHYTLYSLSGQTLREGGFQQHTTVNVSDLPSGHYMLRVEDTDRNQSNVYKVIKIR